MCQERKQLGKGNLLWKPRQATDDNEYMTQFMGILFAVQAVLNDGTDDDVVQVYSHGSMV